MCMECWEVYGSPKIVSGKTESCARAIGNVYSHHEAGGALHVIIDDWNLQDAFVNECKEDIEKTEYRNDPDDPVPDDRLEAERECVRQLEAMSEEERASAMAIYHGYFAMPL